MNLSVKYISFLLFVAALFCTVQLNAQFRCKFEYYSTGAGLSHDAVTCIMKDSEGFVWVGTWNGINRFDGQTFKSFKSTPGDRSELSSDRITQIVEDHAKNLWLKAYDNQVYRFDKRTEKFHPLKLNALPGAKKMMFENIRVLNNGRIALKTAAEGLVIIPKPNQQTSAIHFNRLSTLGFAIPSDTINVLHEDLKGNLWLATTSGISCFKTEANGQYKLVDLNGSNFLTSNFTSVAENSGSLYFGTASGEIVCYNKSLETARRVRVTDAAITAIIVAKRDGTLYALTSAGEVVHMDNGNRISSVNKYPEKEKLLSLYEDRSGNIWIEPENYGVIRYTVQDRQFRKFTHQASGDPTYKGNNFKVYEDRDGRVWVNMKAGGFGYFDGTTIKDFYHTPGSTRGRFASTVTSVYYDPAGVLWFSTVDRGLSKAIFLDDQFVLHELNPLPASRSDNEVRGLYTDKKGRVWIGVKSGKLYVQKDGKKAAVAFTNMPKNGLGQVYAIIGDAKGNVWMGTKSDGLYLAKPTDSLQNRYILTHFRKGNKGKDNLNSNEIYALLEDPQGRIWIGTFDEGLNILERKNGKFIFLNKEHGLVGYPAEGFNRIRNMSLDGAGNVWLATTNGLVVRRSAEISNSAKTFAVYRKIPGNGKSLGSNDIQYILRDSRNTMWIATSGGGLGQALFKDPFQKMTFRNYTTTMGLPSDYVLSIAEDARGNLWAATQNGMVRFNSSTEQIRNYDSYDGLPSATFSEAAVQKLPDGTLLVGTSAGYISFKPQGSGKRPVGANLVLTSLYINNKKQVAADEGLLHSDINYAKQLKLRHDQNIISIDYTVLDPRSGPGNNFEYRLRGFEESWNSSSLQRATYTNLPPGEYLFEVRSTNKNEYLNIPYKSLAVTILPPLWKTWWAYLFYAVLLIAVVEVVRRTVLTMLRLRNRIAVERKLADLKSNFFTHISHELRTPLTLILNPIEVIGDTENLSIRGKAQVEIVRKNANRMVRFINQLLDLKKLESGQSKLKISEFELIGFLKNIAEYFRELSTLKNITLEVVSEFEKLMVKADLEKIDIVIFNLLSNAFKFSPNDKRITVVVSSNPNSDLVTVEVHDQGHGVQDSQLEDIFGLYYQVSDNNHTQVRGTGIGLALSRELITLHQGKIYASSNGDGGLTVTIQLPLGKEIICAAHEAYFRTPEFEQNNLEVMLHAADQVEVLNNQVHAGDEVVLLVEDNVELRNFLASQLSSIYRVEVAANGKEGWELAQMLVPDLILSDVMMPEMNGIEMLDKLKNQTTTSHIPVVLLSAKHAIEHQIEGLRYGADYYITKPFNNEFLLTAIAGLINRRRQLFGLLVERKSPVVQEGTVGVITEKDKAFLEKVIEIVEQQMENSEFNIDAVAVTLGMGRSTFYRKFRSLTNQAPVEFVRDMRLKSAIHFLDEGEKTISEIAYIVGFSTAKYFSTCFRDKYGLSPREYLNQKVSPG